MMPERDRPVFRQFLGRVDFRSYGWESGVIIFIKTYQDDKGLTLENIEISINIGIASRNEESRKFAAGEHSWHPL
jgi:hypothetical protein